MLIQGLPSPFRLFVKAPPRRQAALILSIPAPNARACAPTAGQQNYFTYSYVLCQAPRREEPRQSYIQTKDINKDETTPPTAVGTPPQEGTDRRQTSRVVIARSEATKQSRKNSGFTGVLDCFASLAMTGSSLCHHSVPDIIRFRSSTKHQIYSTSSRGWGGKGASSPLPTSIRRGVSLETLSTS